MKAKDIHDAFHVSLLKPFKSDTFNRYDKPLPPVRIENGVDFYEVEKILATKRIRGKQFYLVHWKGYTDSENSWVSR